MKTIGNISKAIIASSFLWIIGGILISWGIYANGWIRIGIGMLIIYWGITTTIQDYQLDRQVEKWLKENNGKFILFYATKSKIQEKIKTEILPMFDNNILQVFYDGPKIAGDLEEVNYLLKKMMDFNPKIRPHNPSIIKIENGKFIIKDELKLLMRIEGKINKQELKERIEKAFI